MSCGWRDLNLAKYGCWELRDTMLALERRYVRVWEAESVPDGLGAVRTRFHIAQEDAERLARRLDEAQRESALRAQRLPPFATLLSAASMPANNST